VVKTILVTGDQRDRLTDGIYYPKDRYTQQLARLDYAMDIALKAEATEKKIRDAVKKKQLPKKKALELVNEAQAAGIISAEEAALMKEAGAVRLDAIQVDDFSQAEFVKNGV
jgi:acyl-CoA dehydrogenase